MLLELITHKHYSMRFSGPGFTRLRLVSFALYFIGPVGKYWLCLCWLQGIGVLPRRSMKTDLSVPENVPGLVIHPRPFPREGPIPIDEGPRAFG